jgi:hypothetical protein
MKQWFPPEIAEVSAAYYHTYALIAHPRIQRPSLAITTNCNKKSELGLNQVVLVNIRLIVTRINATRVGIVYNPWMRDHFMKRQPLSRILYQKLHTSPAVHHEISELTTIHRNVSMALAKETAVHDQ